MTIELLDLTKEKFCVLALVDPSMVETAESLYEYANKILVKIIVREYQARLGEEIKYPATWWDAIKERFFPFLGVKYTRIVRFVSFPGLTDEQIKRIGKTLGRHEFGIRMASD